MPWSQPTWPKSLRPPTRRSRSSRSWCWESWPGRERHKWGRHSCLPQTFTGDSLDGQARMPAPRAMDRCSTTADRVAVAVEAIRRHWSCPAATAVVLGTGLGELADEVTSSATLSYGDI